MGEGRLDGLNVECHWKSQLVIAPCVTHVIVAETPTSRPRSMLPVHLEEVSPLWNL